MGITSFKGYSDISEPTLTEVMEDNIVGYVDWSFLELGAYHNITIPSSGAYGGNRHKLVCVNDPRYDNGQVWEGYRKNWVWQSGLSHDAIAISGIFIDGEYSPRDSGYSINYRNGQVIFDTAIASTSTVQLEYSHKWVDVVNAGQVPWFRKGQTRSFRADDRLFIANSGNWNELADTRLQLPAVAVEVVGKNYEGYQLGGHQYARPNVLLHVIAEEPQTAKKIASILAEQSESTLYMFDTGKMAKDNRYPLDYTGDIASGALCYPDLIAATGDGGFRYTKRVQHGKMRIAESIEQETDQIHENVYHSKVRWTTEVILTGI